MPTRRHIVRWVSALAAAPAAGAAARASTRRPVNFTYLGNAGWRIDDGRTVILVDPFLTQFRDGGKGNVTTADDSDEVLVPDLGQIAAHAPRADFILITHSHSDHMLDAPAIARRTGATIVGSQGSAEIARAGGVPEAQLIVAKGGDDLAFAGFSLRVVPSLHSLLLAKHYDNTAWAGPVPSGLKAPLHESAYREGGTFAYLLRLAGHRILITGGMNYIEREMQGLAPDVALIGSGASRKEVTDYTGRLMRALGRPAVVFPTHWDSYGQMSHEAAVRGAEAFAREVRAAAPRTRVIIPAYFTPIAIP